MLYYTKQKRRSNKLKKCFLLLVLTLSVVLVGCSTNSSDSQQSDIEKLEQKIATLEKENGELKAKLDELAVEDVQEDSNVDSENKEEEKVEETISAIQIGDVITTDTAEITIKNIEFSYDVLPDDTSNFYTHYPANTGNVYIHIDTDVKNIQKQNLGVEEIMDVVADYNDGYTYNGSPIPEDSTTGFTYANITSIKPLESLGVRFLIECPQEVEESDNSLNLTFQVNDKEYSYKMR